MTMLFVARLRGVVIAVVVASAYIVYCVDEFVKVIATLAVVGTDNVFFYDLSKPLPDDAIGRSRW